MRRTYNTTAPQVPAFQSPPGGRSRNILNGPVPSNRPPGSIIQAAEPMYAALSRGPLLQDQPVLPRQGLLGRPNILDRPSILDRPTYQDRPNVFDNRPAGPYDYPQDYDNRMAHPQFPEPQLYHPQAETLHYPGANGDFDSGRRRERGFDKGPQGEFLANSSDPRNSRGQYNSGHMPNKPVESFITYEKPGDDMEIARSRSNSPRDSRFSNKWRPPRDSRASPTRPNRDRSFQSKRGRSRSPRASRENSSQNYETVSEDTVRDGIIYSNNAYYSFLTYWIAKLDDESRKSNDRDVQGTRQLIEIFTKANSMERHKLVLPPEFKESERSQMLHCDITILGLPSAIFFGSGYGPKETFAKHAAAKDLVDKCHRIGFISSELHAAIGDNRSFDRKTYSREIFQAIDAVIHLRKTMAKENFPKQIMSQRTLEDEVINRFKLILRTVVMKVYYPQSNDNDGNSQETSSPEAFSDGRKRQAGSDSRDRDHRRQEDEVPSKKFDNGSYAISEHEMRERIRKEMEEEIRNKVIEEERSKIREELEREKKIEMIKMQQRQFEMEKEHKERERIALEQHKAAMMMKMSREVDEELDRVLDEVVSKVNEMSELGLTAISEMIYTSDAYKKITSGESVKNMTVEQKQQLVIDLKAILKCASITKTLPAVQPQTTYPTVPSIPSTYTGIVNHAPNRSSSSTKPYYSSISSYSESPASSMQQGGSSSKSYEKKKETTSRHQPASSSNNTNKDKKQGSSIDVNGVTLRPLTHAETRKLAPGMKVVAQDMKTGVWEMAEIVKISNSRALLQVGSSSWKKNLTDLYWQEGVPY